MKEIYIFLRIPLLWNRANDRLIEPRTRVWFQREKDNTPIQAHGTTNHMQKTQD
jgi:hypothetical protein